MDKIAEIVESIARLNASEIDDLAKSMVDHRLDKALGFLMEVHSHEAQISELGDAE
jgi:hypothetical protein